MGVECEVCGRSVPQRRRGITLYHPGCKPLHDDLIRMRKHLAKIAAGTHPAQLSPRKLAELRFDLFCLVSELPRPRDEHGRYVSSQLSAEYDRTVAQRRARDRTAE